MQKVIKSKNLNEDLRNVLSQLSFDRLFILVDDNTEKLCFSIIEDYEVIKTAGKIFIKSGDNHKNLETLVQVWRYLSDHGATRHSLLINLGGGMLTDLGAFAAATFKRGIKFINIPTTILGAVDAAVGGKTGINFNGLKNEIGAFAPAEVVLIDSNFFRSLDHQNILSGYAEILKHSLIASEQEWTKCLSFNFIDIDYQKLQELVVDSVAIKERIVDEDPFENGIRKALNLGHTIGHAFESLSYELGNPVQHGYAVAWGLVCELYLSWKFCQFPQNILAQTISFIKANYSNFYFGCNHYEALYQYMRHDKKNISDTINFTFLKNIGEVQINQTATKEDIFESIDFLRESFGL